MCLLTFLPPDVQPDPDALACGAFINADGHGYAIVTDDRIIVARGMDAADLIEQFTTLRRRYTGGPALFHSRLTTHGSTGPDNCQPFTVGGDPRTVVAHNGILPTLVQPANGDQRSDTRILAEEFLPVFGPLHTHQARTRLQRWITPHNKIVVLTVDRRYRESAYILNEQAGVWHDGIWYSNDSYLPLDQQHWALWAADYNEDWTAQCPWCRAVVDPADTECLSCGWCVDCGERPEHCLCHHAVRPRHLRLT